MLLFDDLNIIEVENGVMYLTSLYNFAQPLIRYRLSDHLVLKEPMPGSPFSRAEILLGRNEDLLWFEDTAGRRDFLHPLAVEGFCIEGLLDYQFRQTAPDAFEMLAEAAFEERKPAIEAEILRQTGNLQRHHAFVFHGHQIARLPIGVEIRAVFAQESAAGQLLALERLRKGQL